MFTGIREGSSRPTQEGCLITSSETQGKASKEAQLEQWPSTSLRLQPLNTAPQVVLTPNIK